MLDPRTVFLCTLLSDIALATVLFQLWRQNRHSFSGIGYWTIGVATLPLALALIMLRGMIPDGLSIVIGVSLFPFANMILIMGLERFFGAKSSFSLQLSITLLLVPYLAVYTYLQPNMHMRVIGYNAINVVQMILGIQLIQKRIAVEFRAMAQLSAVLFALIACCSAWRIGIAMRAQYDASPFTTERIDSLPLLLMQVFTMLLVISWVVLLFRRQTKLLEIAQQENLRNVARYKTVVENSPTSIAIINHKELFTYVNAQFCTLLDTSAEEIIGRDFKTFIAPEDITVCVNIFHDRQAGCADVPRSSEVNIVTSKGHRKIAEVHGAILERSLDSCLTIIQAIDITERKAVEAAQNHYQRELERRLHHLEPVT